MHYFSEQQPEKRELYSLTNILTLICASNKSVCPTFKLVALCKRDQQKTFCIISSALIHQMQSIKESIAAFLEKVQCNNSSHKDKPTRKVLNIVFKFFLYLTSQEVLCSCQN